MHVETSTRRRSAPTILFALLFLLGTALAARATVVPAPHVTLNGIAGIDLHGTFAVWTSDHSGSGHFTATIYWDDSDLAATSPGAVSSNGPKIFETQGTHNYAGPGPDPLIHERIYNGFVHVTDSQDDSSADIGFAVVIRKSQLVPAALFADDSSDAETNSDVDGIFEFGETILLNPSWSNEADNLNHVTGTLSSFTRGGITAGETYTIMRGAAEYGNLAKYDVHDCFNGNVPCFKLSATLTGPRPQTHIDAQVTEEVTGEVFHTWTIHMGGSFSDVVVNSGFYKDIETILHNGVTLGYGDGTFGPAGTTTRMQAAIFITRAMFQGDETQIPSTGTGYNCSAVDGLSMFTDIPATSPFCKHVNYLASRQIVLGCTTTQFCPNNLISRAQTAMLLARSQPPLYPGGETDVPMAYTGPTTGRTYDCNVATANVPFPDVSANQAICRFVGYVWSLGIVDGFQDGTFHPNGLSNRAQMAKMLTRAFQLKLYQP
ncbi:MAG TPA: S-layer homology domain-containing protein [Thermoanaerobaculia bacterium]|nr:S-layer homology domain-containing protein [Thermoanaerobaculia bacterium]